MQWSRASRILKKSEAGIKVHTIQFKAIPRNSLEQNTASKIHLLRFYLILFIVELFIKHSMKFLYYIHLHIQRHHSSLTLPHFLASLPPDLLASLALASKPYAKHYIIDICLNKQISFDVGRWFTPDGVLDSTSDHRAQWRRVSASSGDQSVIANVDRLTDVDKTRN